MIPPFFSYFKPFYGYFKPLVFINYSLLFNNSNFLLNFPKTYLFVWTDKTDQANNAGVGEKLGNFTNSSDIFFSVRWTESKIFIESESDVVSVEDVGWHVFAV